MSSPHFVTLENHGDNRGSSYSPRWEVIARLRSAKNVHFASIRGGCVRGNHAHRTSDETILIFTSGPVSVYWAESDSSPVKSRFFDGEILVAVEMPRGCFHAIRNEGHRDLFIVSALDDEYNPECPDAVKRVLVDPLGALEWTTPP